MPVNIRAKLEISAELNEAMRKAPEIVGEELVEGMKEVATIRDRVRQQISSRRLMERGRLWRSVSAWVSRDAGRSDVEGVTKVGARHAGIHEHGGTIRAKRGGFLVFPLGERVEITHTQRRDGSWRELKRTRMETIPQRWVRVKSVQIPAQWYFFRGVRQGMPAVERSLDRAAYRALSRVFAGGETEG